MVWIRQPTKMNIDERTPTGKCGRVEEKGKAGRQGITGIMILTNIHHTE